MAGVTGPMPTKVRKWISKTMHIFPAGGGYIEVKIKYSEG